MTVFAAGGLARTMDFEGGDVGYIDISMPHYIENTGDEDLVFIEVFLTPFYEDISLAEWLAHTPSRLVDEHLQVGEDFSGEDCEEGGSDYAGVGITPGQSCPTLRAGCAVAPRHAGTGGAKAQFSSNPLRPDVKSCPDTKHYDRDYRNVPGWTSVAPSKSGKGLFTSAPS